MDNQFEEDYLPLPDETEEEAVLSITEDQLIEEIMGTDENGHSRSVCVVSLTEIEEQYLDEDLSEDYPTGVIPDEEDKREIIEELNMLEYAVAEHSIDGDLLDLEITFDNPLSPDMKDLLRLLNTHKQKAAEYENTDGAKYPILAVYIAPTRYPGQGIASYVQPVTYFKAIPEDKNPDDEYRSVHMIFKVENTMLNLYEVKQSEIDDLDAAETNSMNRFTQAED